MPQDNHDVIVIGGGMAGLSAALHLAERGLTPLVLDADKRLGGRLSSKDENEINGWRFRLEHGIHGIWSPYRNLQAMLARHNLRPVLVPAQEELWVYRDAHGVHSAPVGSTIRHSIVPAPLHYLQLFFSPKFLSVIEVRDWIKLFNVWYLLTMAVGVDPFGEDQSFEGETLGKYVHDWSPALREFLIGLARNGLAANANEIPLAGFLAFLRFYTILRRDTWAFSYLPHEGGTSICAPLADKIMHLGAQFRLNTHVARLEKAGDCWIIHAETTSGAIQLRAQAVVVATDSPSAEKIIRASFPTEAAKLFFPRGLANAIVRLWFNDVPKAGAESGIFTGDFTAHNFFWLHRIYPQYRRWHRETGGSAIEMHVYGPPQVLEQSDAWILSHVITDAYQAFPELRGHLIGQHLQRNPASHTLPSLGARGTHLGIETPWENLFCAGDWVRDPIQAFFLERACTTGILAANAILKRRVLEPWVLLNYLPPEPFAAWIQSLMIRGRNRQRAKKQK